MSIVLWLFVGYRFHVLFHSRLRVLFIFPSQYWFTIGKWLVFRITQWSGQIQTGLHVSRPTQDTSRYQEHFGYGGVALYAIFFQRFLLYSWSPRWSPTTPCQKTRFVLFPFRSPLLRESLSFSFPLVTEMFHFTRFAFWGYVLAPKWTTQRLFVLLHSEIPGSQLLISYPRLIAD